MAIDKRKFPSKNVEFNNYLNAGVPYLNTNSGRLNVSGDNLSELNDLYNDPINGWKFLYQVSTDEAKATKLHRLLRNSCRKKIENVLTAVFGDIPQSILTSKDRLVLRLGAKKKSRTRAPKMKKAPTMTMREMRHLMHRLFFKNPETPDTKAMPYKNHIALEYYIGETGLLAKDIPFANAMEITRALKIIAFNEGNVGKTIYYRCCYVNTRNERSGWSVVKSEVIA